MSRVGALLRLWIILALAYLTIKLAFDLLAMGWIDARPIVLWELLTISLGQAIALQLVTARAARGA